VEFAARVYTRFACALKQRNKDKGENPLPWSNEDKERLLSALQRIADALEACVVPSPQTKAKTTTNLAPQVRAHATSSEVKIIAKPAPRQTPPPLAVPQIRAHAPSSGGNETEQADLFSPVRVSAQDVPHIITFLENQFIQPLKGSIFDSALPKGYDQVVFFMGENFDEIAPLLYKMKQSIPSGLSSFEMRVMPFSPRRIETFCTFCNLLIDAGLIMQYTPRIPVRNMCVRFERNGLIQNFFCGYWFERYIRICAENCVRETLQKYQISEMSEFVSNLRVKLPPEHTDFEMDLLVHTVNRVFWVECKTGQFDEHILRYARFGDKYHFLPNQAFLVVSGLDETRCAQLTRQYKLHVCNHKTFPQIFTQVLESYIDADINSLVAI
jgi:hypothetical protein